LLAQDVCDDPANRTLNCDFATDIYGWVLELGTNSSHSLDGDIGSGSIEVQSEPDSPDELIKINQCVGGPGPLIDCRPTKKRVLLL